MAAVYTVQWVVAEPRHVVSFQGLRSVGHVLRVSPSGFVGLMNGEGGLPESRHYRCVLLGQGIFTFSDRGAIFSGLLTSAG